MGWGGILGAIAQGLGTGMVKNVEYGWKDEAAQKEMDWRSKEADKQRSFESEQTDKKFQHDFALEDHKTRNAISEAASKARIAARYKTGGVAESQTKKDLTNAMQILGVYDSQLNDLQEKLNNTDDEAQKDAITKRMGALAGERNGYLNRNDTINIFKNADQMGRALYSASGGDVGLFEPKPQTLEPISPVQKIIEPPKRNVIDANNLTQSQLNSLSKQKSEESARQKFLKAQEESKEWAEKRNQYSPTMFIPRTF